MDVNVAHLDTGKLHPLHAHYFGQYEPQPAYVEFDKHTGSLTAGWDGAIGGGVPIDVWEGERLLWPISYELTEAEVNNLLDEIAEKIKWDAEEGEWLIIPDDHIEGIPSLAAWARDNSDAHTDSKGIWEAADWYGDNASWDGLTVNILDEWIITATSSDTDLEKIANSMQDDANGDGVTLWRVDSYLSALRDEAIEKSEED